MRNHKNGCPCVECEDKPEKMGTSDALWAIIPPYIALVVVPFGILYFLGWVGGWI